MTGEHNAVLLACDIDDTLLAVDSRSLAERQQSAVDLARLCRIIGRERSAGRRLYFGSATGRSLASHKEREQQSPEFAAAAKIMDFTITSVGSAITLLAAGQAKTIEHWPPASGWSRDRIESTLLVRPELAMQSPEGQDTYKVSFDVSGVSDDAHAEYVQTIADQLADADVPAQILFSGGRFLDILPAGVHKGSALIHTVGALAVERCEPAPLLTIASGDSMNDRDLLHAADNVIIPANAHDSLKGWVEDNIDPANAYFAQRNFAAGIIEGYVHFVA